MNNKIYENEKKQKGVIYCSTHSKRACILQQNIVTHNLYTTSAGILHLKEHHPALTQTDGGWTESWFFSLR